MVLPLESHAQNGALLPPSPPQWPLLIDADQDGLADADEILLWLNPLDAADGLSDLDGDGLSLAWEWQIDTAPDRADTDADGWSDSDELLVHGTDPRDATSRPADAAQVQTSSASPQPSVLMNVASTTATATAPPSLINGDFTNASAPRWYDATKSTSYQGRGFKWGEGNASGWTAYRGSSIEIWQTNGQSFVELDGNKGSYGIKQPIKDVRACSLLLAWKQSGRNNPLARNDAYYVQIYYQNTNGAMQVISKTPVYQGFSKTAWTDNAHVFTIKEQDIQAAAGAPIYVAFIPEDLNTYGTLIDDVNLLPVEVVSRDKYLAGSFDIPDGWDSLEMEFVGPGGSLGKYGNLLGGGSTKIYDKVEDVMADADYAAGGQADTQKVWFVRDSTDARKINYYTCFDSTGDVQIKLYLNGKPESIGEIAHTLTAAEDFAAVIDYVDQWVKGTSFDFTGGVITPPLAMRGMSMNAAGGGGIHNLTRAALIPFFNVVNNVEGLGSVAFGLFDGIKEGVGDDWKLIQLIKSGALGAGGWAIQAAEQELNKWKDDPLKRAAELKKAADRLCQEWVFKPMEQVQADLSTWEGFKKRSWQVWKSVEGTANKAWVLTQSSWESIKTGLKDWVNDFADRMMEGAEKAHWSESVLSMDKIQGDINEYTRQASYTFGYTFGYLSEQVAVGILTGGTVKVAAIMTKGGVKVAGALAARRVLPVVARLQFVKKWAASVAISIEMKIAVERGLTIAAEAPLSALIKDSVAEVIERGMARATYERASFSTSKVLDEVLNGVFLKKLIATPGLEGRFWQRMGEWFYLLADDATAAASKGWVKVFNRSLKFDGDILLDDRMPDLYKLAKAQSAEGKAALKKSLDEFGATDGNGKFWLRDLHTVYEDMYHHLSVSSFNRLRVRSGNAYLSEFTGDRGWYVTPDKFLNAEDAKSSLQLFDILDGRYRCKFKTAQAKDNLKAARGRSNSKEYFEFTCKDYPENGTAGGGSQLLLDHKEVLLDEVYDTVLQRNLTILEIQNLGGL